MVEMSNTNSTSSSEVDRKWMFKLLQKHRSTGTEDRRLTCDPLTTKHPILRNKILAVAPMVEQSDLPFRMLCRRYGANVCYTPMINARYFVKNKGYRDRMFRLGNDDDARRRDRDRPLIAQLCANNRDVLVEAARLLERHVDAIDVNLGCPTKVARRGRFGAYLLESGEYVVDMVRHLAEHASVPVTAKVRLLPRGIEESCALYSRLVDAGVALLTVHGRTKLEKGANTGRADWDAIREVVKRLGDRVPIIANGSMRCLDDVIAAISYTGADGVMSFESILEYPPLYSDTGTAAVKFKRTGPGRLQIAREYLDLCKEFPPHEGGGGTRLQCIKMHLQVFCHGDWKDHKMLHDSLFPIRRHEFDQLVESHASELDYFNYVLDQVAAVQGTKHIVEDERLSWYMRHRTNEDT